MIKILITTPQFIPSKTGLPNAVYNQVLCLKSLGYNVLVATHGIKRKSLYNKKLDVIIEEFPISGSRYFFNPIKGPINSYIQYVINNSFDVIILNAWQNWATDLILEQLKLIKSKVFLYSHCISTQLFFKNQIIKSLIRLLFWMKYHFKVRMYIKQLEGLIFLADKGFDCRFNDLKLAKKLKAKIFIIPNAVNITDDLLIYQFKDRIQIIAVGDYKWQKGFEFVIKSYALSNAMNKIPLKLFGFTKTKFLKDLIILSKKLGIKNKFIDFKLNVTGNDLYREYQKSILLLSGSYTECQPMSHIEANKLGTPFISKKTGCITFMRGGQSVITQDQASNTINNLIINQTDWNNLSEQGIISSNSDHSMQNMKKLFTQIFNF